MQRVVTVLLLAAVAGGALIAGCDIPTAAPILELRWALTAAETTLGVEDLLREGRISLAVDDTAAARGSRRLLPASAANESPPGSCEPASSAGEVVSGEGSITVSAEPICVAWTLAELCPTCHVGQPIAGIDTVKEQTWVLPPEVVSVRISSGMVMLSLAHDLDGWPLVLPSGRAGGPPLLACCWPWPRCRLNSPVRASIRWGWPAMTPRPYVVSVGGGRFRTERIQHLRMG